MFHKVQLRKVHNRGSQGAKHTNDNQILKQGAKTSNEWRKKKTDVKKLVMSTPAEDADSQNWWPGEATEEDLQAAEYKGYADGFREGQEWLRNNPKL